MEKDILSNASLCWGRSFYLGEGCGLREIWKHLQFMFTGVGAWVGWFLSGFDGFVYALVAFATIDYVTGFRSLSTILGGVMEFALTK